MKIHLGYKKLQYDLVFEYKHSHSWFIYRVNAVILFILFFDFVPDIFGIYAVGYPIDSIFDYWNMFMMSLGETTEGPFMIVLLYLSLSFHIYYGLEELILDYFPPTKEIKKVHTFLKFTLKVLLIACLFQVLMSALNS